MCSPSEMISLDYQQMVWFETHTHDLPILSPCLFQVTKGPGILSVLLGRGGRGGWGGSGLSPETTACWVPDLGVHPSEQGQEEATGSAGSTLTRRTSIYTRAPRQNSGDQTRTHWGF